MLYNVFRDTSSTSDLSPKSKFTQGKLCVFRVGLCTCFVLFFLLLYHGSYAIYLRVVHSSKVARLFLTIELQKTTFLFISRCDRHVKYTVSSCVALFLQSSHATCKHALYMILCCERFCNSTLSCL